MRPFPGLAIVYVTVLSCSGTDPETRDPQQDDADTPTTYAASGPTTCYACTCDNGLRGISRCEEYGNPCDCSSCPDFEPLQPKEPDFVPCGGEPWGTWRSTTVDWSSFDLGLEHHSAVNITQPLDWRIELDEGGSGSLFIGSTSIEFQAAPPSDGECYEIDAFGSDTTTTCTELECGLCDCTSESEVVEDGVSWSKDEATLIIDGEDWIGSLSYCVDGAQMQVELHDGRIVTLERVFGTGVPGGCSDRSVEQCRSGCRLGGCMGDDCPTDSESACSTYAGCSWEPDACVGSPSEQCSLGDYDIVPGCKFVAEATCTGTATPCYEFHSSNCTSQTGCTEETWCGGGTIDCADVDNCGDIEGCTIGDYYTCEGTTTCAAQGEFCGPSWKFGCERSDCSGTAKACEELDNLECEQQRGCALTPL